MLGSLLQSSTLPIGIDLGAGGARLLQLSSSRGGLSLVSAASIELSEPAPTPDDPAWIATLIESIGQRYHAGQFQGSRCVLSLDDRLLRVRSVRQPRMPDDELDRAVRLDAPQRLGFDESNPFVVDWLRAGEIRQGDEVKDEVLLFGASRATLERIVFGLSDVGLSPVALEPGFVATGRCYSQLYRRTSDQESVRVVVDIGLRTTGVMLLRGQSIAFYKMLELGGREMNAAAAKKLGLDLKTTIELRRQRAGYAFNGSEPLDAKVDRALFDAVRSTMDDLAHEVNLCIRHCSVTFRGSRPERVTVVGGEAMEPQLAEHLGKAIGVETTIGRPLEGVNLSTGIFGTDRRGPCPHWSVATGLCLREQERLSQRGFGPFRRTRTKGLPITLRREENGEQKARQAA